MIEIRDLSVTYTRATDRGAGSETEAVRGLSLTLRKGELCALAGESGSGKSTVLMSIPGLLPAGTRVGGEILLDGTNLLSLNEDELNELRWRRIAIVPQGAMNSFTPVITVGAHVEEVLDIHLGMTGQAASERTERLFASAGLDPSCADRYPHELSGGQKQRAAIALALACDPDWLLCDEPTTALDVVTQKAIIDELKGLVESSGVGMLLVSHDLPLAASACSRLLIMKDGELAEEGTPGEIVARPKSEHSAELVNALLDLEREGER
ncbi:MAG: ABC transporter ATP-binding protein [Synergistaceae bacterium]|nr:ABC transporter ATP-binding protein [Synergistota bacterium]NLM71000.1 ABC transporter ATP-binding protein [Synergistaceae bacterium]